MVLKGKFCAKCGAKEDNLVENLCTECYLELHEVKVPKSKEFKLCSKCGSILVDNFWVTVDKQNRDVYTDQIKKAIKLPDKINIIKVDLIKIAANGLVEVTFDIKGDMLVKEYLCNLKVQKQLCPICKDNIKTETRAKLQFRVKQNTEKVISEILTEIHKFKKHIVKINKLRTGIDVFLNSRQESLTVARYFK